MRIDLSFLPALGAAFLLVFARIGTMLMLLPGLGEQNISARMRLTFALILAATLLPLHRDAYHIDATALGPVLVMLIEEILIGAMLGVTARLTISRSRSRAPSSPSSSALALSPRSIRPRASRA